MMKPKELRTGNLVLLEEKHIARVTKIDVENNIVTTDNPYNIAAESDFIQGVPLSPEWLVKFGFEVRLFKDGSGALIRIRMHPLFIGALFKKSDYFEFQTGPEPRIIKYVHELQNYYRDLTGEELTIKETV